MLTLLLALTLVALATGLALRAVALPRLQALSRLEDVSAYGLTAEISDGVDRDSSSNGLSRVAHRLGHALARRAPKVDIAEVRALLLAAGHYRTAAETFIGYRVLAVVGLLGFAVLTFQPNLLGFARLIFLGLGGWILPMTLLKRRGAKRQSQIEDDLPDLIDLLVVTIEAGVSFSGSVKVAAQRAEGPLSEELRLTLQEQKMGLPLADALMNMLERCESPSMRSFVRSVTQGERLGVSIGTIMRNLAVEMRKRRKARAEERAGKAPIKLLFPLVFLIFPALFVVLLAPAMLSISETLGGI